MTAIAGATQCFTKNVIYIYSCMYIKYLSKQDVSMSQNDRFSLQVSRANPAATWTLTVRTRTASHVRRAPIPLAAASYTTAGTTSLRVSASARRRSRRLHSSTALDTARRDCRINRVKGKVPVKCCYARKRK